MRCISVNLNRDGLVAPPDVALLPGARLCGANQGANVPDQSELDLLLAPELDPRLHFSITSKIIVNIMIMIVLELINQALASSDYHLCGDYSLLLVVSSTESTYLVGSCHQNLQT